MDDMDHSIEKNEHCEKQDIRETVLPLADIKRPIEENLPLPSVKEILASLRKHVMVRLRDSNFDSLDSEGMAKMIKDDFFSAARCGDLETLKKFICMFGKDKLLNIKTKYEASLLHFASRHGQYEICDYLLSNFEFDVNMKDIKGNTPLHYAVLGQKKEVGKFCEKYMTPIVMQSSEDFGRSVQVGDKLKTIDVLVKHHVDVNPSNLAQQSALHFAAQLGNIDVIKHLISLRCDALSKPTDFGTPLCSAAAFNHGDALNYLLNHGGDANIVADGCLSPLLVAITSECERCAIMLIDHRANPNYTARGVTPLGTAILFGSMEIFKSLLDHGANTNYKNIYGLVPLELAAQENNIHMVNELLDRTVPIEGIEDWSVSGVMDHCHSEEYKTKIKLKIEEVLSYYLFESEKAFEARKYMSAITWYSLVRCIDEDDASFFARISLCYAGMKHMGEALTNALDCMKLNPNHPMGCYATGVAWNLHKQFGSAAKSFEKACELDGDKQIYKDALRGAIKNLLARYKVI